MRQLTKLTAAMLMLGCAMTMIPERAVASIWSSLEELTYTEPESNPCSSRGQQNRAKSSHSDVE